MGWMTLDRLSANVRRAVLVGKQMPRRVFPQYLMGVSTNIDRISTTASISVLAGVYGVGLPNNQEKLAHQIFVQNRAVFYKHMYAASSELPSRLLWHAYEPEGQKLNQRLFALVRPTRAKSKMQLRVDLLPSKKRTVPKPIQLQPIPRKRISVSQKVIARDHHVKKRWVFRNRAIVGESGMMVHVRPVKSKMLVYPYYGSTRMLVFDRRKNGTNPIPGRLSKGRIGMEAISYFQASRVTESIHRRHVAQIPAIARKATKMSLTLTVPSEEQMHHIAKAVASEVVIK